MPTAGVFIGVFSLPLVIGHLIVTPLNQVATVGSRVIFHCQTNLSTSTIIWKYIPVGKQLTRDITATENGVSYSVSSSISGIYNFSILSVKINDSGIHSWSEDEGSGEPFAVELVVLRSDPVCESNVTLDGVLLGDFISITCNLSYSGNLEPKVKWKSQNELLNGSSEIKTNGTIRSYTCTAVVKVIQGLQGKLPIYQLILSFTATRGGSQNSAVNDPVYTYNWTLPVDVLVPVSQTRINVTRNTTVMYLGETILCSAEGSSEILFLWQEFNGSSLRNVSFGRYLTLNIVGEHRYRCLAENFIKNKTHMDASETVSIIVYSQRIDSTPSSESEQKQTSDAEDNNVSADAFNTTTTTVENDHSSYTNSAADNGVSQSHLSVVIATDVVVQPSKLHETSFFITTLFLGSILVIAFIAFLIYRFLIKFQKVKQSQRHNNEISDSHYLSLSTTDSRREIYAGAGDDFERKSEIYAEIDDSQVDSKAPEFIRMQSNYITCPAELGLLPVEPQKIIVEGTEVYLMPCDSISHVSYS